MSAVAPRVVIPPFGPVSRLAIFASTALPIFVHGEVATERKAIAREIHAGSARHQRSLVMVDCMDAGATIDRVLFGFAFGSVIGPGQLDSANGGTLFLDQIEELPRTTQLALRRVLDTGEFRRVGNAKVQRVDVRIVAGTSANVARTLASGKLRRDLYFRLNLCTLTLG